MSIERLESMKNSLMSCVEGQFSDLKGTDAHELGEAVDMIKDLSEAIYYCTVTEAMQKKEKEELPQTNNITYYTVSSSEKGDSMPSRMPIRYMGPDTNGNIGNNMYYENGSSSGNNTLRGITYYEDGMNRRMMGTSPTSRRMYMEAKDMHKGNAVQIQELENYMKDLSKDITDMIQDSTMEEKMLLRQKLTTLADKINPNNVSN